MQRIVIGVAGLMLCLCTVFALAEGLPVAPTVPPEIPTQRAAAAGPLIALDGRTLAAGRQITVIDAERRVMAVYHVDEQSGQIELKAVRDITWDLRMEQFNNARGPSPHEIRGMFAEP